MDSNAISDAILATLTQQRVYRNKPPTDPIFPYIVCTLESLNATDPSTDYYLNIDICEDPDVSVREMETIADNIQDNLDNKVINDSNLNIHIVIEQRQYISNKDLVTHQMINIRFVCRCYFKN